MCMKKIILSNIFCFTLSLLFAQSNYIEAIQQGDNAFIRDEYATAIKKYLIAETFDQSKWKIVQEKLDTVYSIIEKKQKELEKTIEELKLITAQKEELEHKLLSVKEDVEQMKQKLVNLVIQVQDALKTMDSIILQTDELKNRLSQIKNINYDK